jgi:Ca2+-binding RTX toxin-like protein
MGTIFIRKSLTAARGINIVDGGDGIDTLVDANLSGMTTNLSFDETLTSKNFASLTDGSSYTNFERFINLTTGSGNDIINLSQRENNTLSTGAGSDTINGGLGNDSIDGGSGNDLLVLDYSSNTYSGGGSGVKTSLPGNGTSSFNGTYSAYFNSAQMLDNVSFANIECFHITGTASNDNIITGDGNDTINGARGNDTIVGGAGDDTINSGLGFDTVDGGVGNDLLVIDYSSNPYLGTVGGLTAGIFSNTLASNGAGGFNGNFVAFRSNSNSDADTVRFSNIERFQIPGTAVGDNIRTGDSNDTINGGSGNDTIDGGVGINVIDGGDGIDILVNGNFSSAINSINANNINSFITLADGTNIRNIERFTNLTTGSGNDTISFTIRDNNTINTGAGDDTINSGLGFDTVDGGVGNDLLVIDYSSNPYLGTVGGLTAGIFSNTFTSNGVGGFNGNFVAFRSNSNSDADTVRFSNIERFQITGTTVGDNIRTGDGNDTINGGAGNDTINAQGGNDILDGGAGNDTLIGGTGNDSYFVDSASDSIQETSTATTEIDSVTSTITFTLGSNLENLVLAGSNAINGTGNGLNNQITGNIAANSLSGAIGNDTLDGGAGNDTLDGGDGNDSLLGSDGNDRLLGGAGIDTLVGGLGDDTLAGGAANDILTGSGGSDRFLYDTNAIFAAAAIGVDQLTDFTLNTDKIILDKTTFTALRSIAGSGFSTASDFASVTTDAAAATSSAFIAYNRVNGKLFYNQNGTTAGLGTGGQFVTLTGLPNLTASDFLIQA